MTFHKSCLIIIIGSSTWRGWRLVPIPDGGQFRCPPGSCLESVALPRTELRGLEPAGSDESVALPRTAFELPTVYHEFPVTKYFVINLERSTNRMATFQTLASAAGITCERFPGVDGSQLDLNDLFNSD